MSMSKLDQIKKFVVFSCCARDIYFCKLNNKLLRTMMPTSTVYSLLLKKECAHDDPVYCCAWTKIKPSEDSKIITKGSEYIVTGGLDSLVKVWSLENNKLSLLHSLQGHCMAVVSVAISPDGHTLASTSLDCTLVIWDLVSGYKVHEVQTSATDIWQVTFSPDGTQVISGSHMGKLVVYGIEKGTQERVLDTRGKFAMSVAWSSNGKYIASGAADGAVCIFDASQGKLMHTVEAHTKPVRCVVFSPNSQLLATASNDGKVHVYNVTNASLQSALDHKTWAVAACFSPDGTRVATAAADGYVRVASVDGLKILHTFQEHSDTVWGLQFNAEGSQLLSVSKDKSINLYECPKPPKSNAKK